MQNLHKSHNGSAHVHSHLISKSHPSRQTKMEEESGTGSSEGYASVEPPTPDSKEVTVDERRHLIAEAAYYRAMRRSFMPGNELDDWLDAEAEIEKLLSETDSV